MKKDIWFWLAIVGGLILLSGGAVVVHVYVSRKDFYDYLLPVATQLEKETGIQPDIVLAQAAHESNWGKSQLSQKYNNFFGYKKSQAWTGKTVSLPTTEYATTYDKDGHPISTPYQVNAVFKAYDTPLDSFRDWASLLVRLYPDAYQAAQSGDIVAFGKGLANGKAGAYATDPNYAPQLVSVHDAVEALA